MSKVTGNIPAAWLWLNCSILRYNNIVFLFPFRGETRDVKKYFDGTGYGKIDVVSSKSIKFFVLSRQENALLFFMGNEVS